LILPDGIFVEPLPSKQVYENKESRQGSLPCNTQCRIRTMDCITGKLRL